MIKIKSNRQDLLRYQYPNSISGAIVCSLVLAGGVYVLGLVVYEGMHQVGGINSSNVAGYAAGLVISLVLLYVGIFGLFGNRGLDIDPKQERLILWKSLLTVRYKETPLPFTHFEHVNLLRKVVSNGKNSTTYLIVELANSKSLKKEICRLGTDQYMRQRMLSEDLAKALKSDVHDSATGNVRIRKYEMLDMCVGEQVRRNQEPLEAPEAPADCQVKSKTDGSTLKFGIDKVASGPVLLLVAALFHVPLLIPLIFFLGITLDNGGINLPAVLIGGVIFVVIEAFILHSLFTRGSKRTTITVDNHTLTVQVGTRTTEFPIEEVEEVEAEVAGFEGIPDFIRRLGLFQGRGVLIRSDRDMITVGPQLSSDEILWLSATLRADLGRRFGNAKF